jgi:hypothetical protein
MWNRETKEFETIIDAGTRITYGDFHYLRSSGTLPPGTQVRHRSTGTVFQLENRAMNGEMIDCWINVTNASDH